MNVHAADLAEAQKLFGITPLQPSLGAEIGGIQLSGPLDPAAREALWAALLTYKVLFFRDQEMSREEHIALGAQFGELEVHPAFALPDHPEILPLLSSDMQGKYDVKTDANWHSTRLSARRPRPPRSCAR
jgi:alpha-ketoglutarate-dependent sulfate ester dioxygenase